ncbi:MAG: FAD-binding oxidoreductase [Elusimicrobiota bacterium]
MRSFDATVSQIIQEGRDSKTFRLELPEGASFDFRPGQFVRVAFPEEPEARRPYAIGSSPLEKGFVEITLERLGLGSPTRDIFDLRGGETLRVHGPYGDWQYRDEDRHAVLISSDTGITPLRSMIRYVLDKGLPNRVALFYAARTPSRIIFRRELEDFARNGIQVHVTITEPGGMLADELWDGPTGPITVPAIRMSVPGFREATYYLSGSGRDIEKLRDRLAKAGVARERILYENHGERR